MADGLEGINNSVRILGFDGLWIVCEGKEPTHSSIAKGGYSAGLYQQQKGVSSSWCRSLDNRGQKGLGSKT